MITQRPILIHIHIPKTAGSTINAAVSDALGEHRQFLCAESAHEDHLAAMSQCERDRIDFIFGHYQYGLHKYFTRPVIYTASLRDPRERVHSFYRYVIRKIEHPLHELVVQNTADFQSFLDLALQESKIRDPIDNIEARMLAGAMDMTSDYRNTVRAAEAHVREENFICGDARHVDNLLARLNRALGIRCNTERRLNESEDSHTFGRDMNGLSSQSRSFLDQCAKGGDAIYHAVASDYGW